MSTNLVLLARAADYAARRHIAQRRKGERAEPYVNHLTEVAALLAEATGGDDAVLLMGGLLHDTLEDTDATYEDLAQRFGPEVAALVAEVTDDKSLPQRRAQAPADREDAGQVPAGETAEARRQDLEPARADPQSTGGMDRSAAARLCRVGRAGGAVVPRAQRRAGGRLRCRPCRRQAAPRLRRKRCTTTPPSATTASRRTR